VEELHRELARLITHTGHWGPARWAMPAAGGNGATRAEYTHALVQRLADRLADVEGEPRRRVPRLDNDLAILDQVRVMVADLARGGDESVAAAGAADVAATRRAL